MVVRVSPIDRWKIGSDTNSVGSDAVAIESATSTPGNQAIWTLPLTIPDKYDVYARWGEYDSGASDAKYTITHAVGTDTVAMNQNCYYGYWNKLGTFDLALSFRVSFRVGVQFLHIFYQTRSRQPCLYCLLVWYQFIRSRGVGKD